MQRAKDLLQRLRDRLPKKRVKTRVFYYGGEPTRKTTGYRPIKGDLWIKDRGKTFTWNGKDWEEVKNNAVG